MMRAAALLLARAAERSGRAPPRLQEGCRPVNVYATEDETQWNKLTIEARRQLESEPSSLLS